ncbi:MAG: hypothetical protein JRH10_15690 [Deltaproteobacteria bacterium]|nr:hypothetical protein [Deltaproteobacteria bacterium]MBW2446951.1 hypothetical protein [Deltaproteobacteria bacterium]
MAKLSPRLSRLALGVVLALGLGTGCGYSVVRYKGAIPGVQTLAIANLENGTFEPGVESVVLDALRREAIQRDGLRLIENPEVADLVIDGRVRTLRVNARSFTSVVLSVEYDVTLGLALTATRQDGELIPIDGRAQSDRDRYLASADLEATRKNRREAIHRLAETLADRVYDSLYESASAAADSSTATP